MNPGTRALIVMSGTLATRDSEQLAVAMEEALAKSDPEQVEEILLQSHLFLGFPAALNGLALWRELSGRPAGPAEAEDPAEWQSRGSKICRQVYGSSYQDLRRNVAALHPQIERWMIEDGYGKVLGRDRVSLDVRELCIVGLLAVLDAPAQLHSHLRGALAVGASASDVEEALESVSGLMSATAAERASACWSRTRRRI